MVTRAKKASRKAKLAKVEAKANPTGPVPSASAAKATAFGRYLNERKLPYAQVARELEKTRAWVQMAATGDFTPSASMMWAIEKWSGGAVTMQSWFDG